MNLFSAPQFWLGLSFFIVLGMLLFPAIRQRLKAFFDAYRHKIEMEIQESAGAFQKAVKERDVAKEASKSKLQDKDLPQKMKAIHEEFEVKTENWIKVKKQNFQMRQEMTLNQMKNHLRTELLNRVQEQLSCSSKNKKTSSKEIQHFLKIMHENEEKLKFSLK